MFHSARILLVEIAFYWAWGMARVGVSLLPKDHPLRHYHEYSRENVRPTFLKAARRLR